MFYVQDLQSYTDTRFPGSISKHWFAMEVPKIHCNHYTAYWFNIQTLFQQPTKLIKISDFFFFFFLQYYLLWSASEPWTEVKSEDTYAPTSVNFTCGKIFLMEEDEISKHVGFGVDEQPILWRNSSTASTLNFGGACNAMLWTLCS